MEEVQLRLAAATQRLLARRIPPVAVSFASPGDFHLLREACGFRAAWTRGAPAGPNAPSLPRAARAVLESPRATLTLEAREARVLRLHFGQKGEGGPPGPPGDGPHGSWAVVPAGAPPLEFSVDETREEILLVPIHSPSAPSVPPAPEVPSMEAAPAGAGDGTTPPDDPAFRVAIRRERGEVRVAAEGRLVVTVRAGIDPRVLLRERLLAERRLRRIPGLARSRMWTRATFRFDRPARFYGAGERTGPLEKTGERLVFWNTDDARYHPRSDPLYQSEPVILALFEDGGAAALVLDDPRYTDLTIGGGPEPEIAVRVEGRSLSAHLLSAPDSRTLLAALRRLLGPTPLPPLWALGFQQSRWSYASAAEVISIAEEFRRREIPCDALYLDLDYMDRNRDFTWSPERFPEPEAFLAELHGRGFRAVAVLDPGLAADPAYGPCREGAAGRHLVADRRGRPLRRKVWPGTAVFPDFLRSATRDLWAGWCARFAASGVDGLWTDMNEPSIFDARRTLPPWARHDVDGTRVDHREAHNLYGMQMTRATREGLLRARPEVRPFVLTRSTFLGGHRFAATWTGDNRASWEHLRLSIPMLLNLGLSGFSLAGADIGGFLGSPDEELFLRWLETGVFYPLARNHAAHFTARREPWVFGPGAEALARSLIALRYALLPYLYTAAEEASRTGVPMLRPIFLDDRSRDASRAEWAESEFLVGDALLVAPVLHRGVEAREVYFPAGKWITFDPGPASRGDAAGRQAGAGFRGGSVARVAAPIGAPPLFARAGSAIPIAGPVQNTGELRDASLTFHLVPGAEGQAAGSVYLDDGETDAFARGEFYRLSIAASTGPEGLRVRHKAEGNQEFGAFHRGALGVLPPGGSLRRLDLTLPENILQS